MTNPKIQQTEKRNLLSSFFITLLIGVAFQEMISVARESLQTSGITLSTFCFFLIFLFISIRFFIGNQLHLLSDAFTRLHGLLWLYDLMVIIVQCIVLVFIGSYSSIEANKSGHLGSLEFIVILYTIDVVWILSQWVLGKVSHSWRREFIPWAWAILNSLLIISMLLLDALVNNMYTTSSLAWLLFLNFIGFIADVILVDYYDAV